MQKYDTPRGFTLIETVIVIAVSSILLTTIVLLTVSMSDYTSGAAAVSRRSDDAAALHDAVKEWYSYYDSSNYYAAALPEGGGVSVTEMKSGGSTYTLTFYYGTLTAQYPPSGESTEPTVRTVYAETVQYVTFAEDTTSGVIKCTVTFADDAGSTSFLLLHRSSQQTQSQQQE